MLWEHGETVQFCRGRPFYWAYDVIAAMRALEARGEIRGGSSPSMPTNLKSDYKMLAVCDTIDIYIVYEKNNYKRKR